MKPAFLWILAGAFALPAHAPAQQQAPQPQPAAPEIRTTAQEVVLDMVFRDKKGRTIRDVRPEEIHVFEQGVEQKLNSFRIVEGATSRVIAGDGPVTPLDPMREIRLVSLVFEGLDNESKRFFRQAVKDLLEMAPEQNLYFSILAVDQRLHCLQPFTADRDALMKSLKRMENWAFAEYSTQSADVKARLLKVVSTEMPTALPGTPAYGSVLHWRLAKSQYEMLKAADAADREFEARATLAGLSELVRAQSALPGRKVILYFNQHLRIPANLDDQYKSLKGLANRGNVTFYTVDPSGLVTDYQATGRGVTSASERAAGRDQLRDAAEQSRKTFSRLGDLRVTPEQARAGETAVSAVRSNPQGWLRDLAEETGGAAIGDTNDWKAPLRTAMEEVRTYFEASYTPQIAAYDGKFRPLSVTIDRPEVRVHSRSGYYALPVLGGGRQLYAFELPLLNALMANPAPADLSFRAAAQRFNPRGPKIEYMLTVEAPLGGLVFEAQPEKKTATVNASMLLVLRDTHGEIADKFSKDFAVQVDLDKVAGYKAGNLVQTFRAELSPGPYTLEVAVMDRQGGKLGVKKMRLAVPDPTVKLALSEIAVVGRQHSLPNTEILDAFYYEDGKIVPALAESLQGGPGKVLPFYFVVYPAPSPQPPAGIAMSFYAEGQFLGSAQAPLPAPQKDGRIPYIANLPADRFLPGNYEIRLAVEQGGGRAEEKIAFRVE